MYQTVVNNPSVVIFPTVVIWPSIIISSNEDFCSTVCIFPTVVICPNVLFFYICLNAVYLTHCCFFSPSAVICLTALIHCSTVVIWPAVFICSTVVNCHKVVFSLLLSLIQVLLLVLLLLIVLLLVYLLLLLVVLLLLTDLMCPIIVMCPTVFICPTLIICPTLVIWPTVVICLTVVIYPSIVIGQVLQGSLWASTQPTTQKTSVTQWNSGSSLDQCGDTRSLNIRLRPGQSSAKSGRWWLKVRSVVTWPSGKLSFDC